MDFDHWLPELRYEFRLAKARRSRRARLSHSMTAQPEQLMTRVMLSGTNDITGTGTGGGVTGTGTGTGCGTGTGTGCGTGPGTGTGTGCGTGAGGCTHTGTGTGTGCGPGSNVSPVADAGADFTISVGGSASFDGSGSYDPDGSPCPLGYQWSVEQMAGPLLGDDSSDVSPTFSWSELVGLGWSGGDTFTVTLTVNDGHRDPNTGSFFADAFDSDTVDVTVQPEVSIGVGDSDVDERK